MKKLLFSFTTFLLLICAPKAKADLGFHYGMGLPFIGQLGLDYTLGTHLTLTAGTNNINLSNGEAEVDLTMNHVMLNWHPFNGAFYIGVGAGQETLTVEATDAQLGASAKAEVSANVTLARVGWMWGKANSGFWFGMDITYVSPSGGEVTVESNVWNTSSQEYQDVVDAGEQFGETAYTNFTFARLGILF